jgi:signal transduction histidine kinase
MERDWGPRAHDVGGAGRDAARRRAQPSRAIGQTSSGAKPRRVQKDTAGRARQSDDGDFEIIIDRDHRIRRITHDAATWCGATSVELIGVDGRERWPSQPSLDEAIAAALSKGQVSTVVYASLIAPGRWVETDVEPLDDGARIRFRDVTSRVLAEQSRRTPNDLVHPSLGAGPAEIVLLDQRGVIVAANATWRASFGAYKIKLPDAGVGARYAAVAKATLGEAFDEAAFQARLDETLSSASQFEATYNLETPHGRELRHLQITPLRLGQATYFVAMHEDFTERARVLAELRETSGQLLRAKEDERQRIALELHDSTNQHLAGLMQSLSQLRRGMGQDLGAQALIDEMAKLTQQIVHETRVLSYLMNGTSQEREGLKASVQRFVEGFGPRTGLTATFEAIGPVDAVNAAAQHAVFRVIQEALTNVYRHADATNVAVSLESNGAQLTVRIADDGRGFSCAQGNAQDAPLGVGIPGMRARVDQLGGTLVIDSPGSGAVVTATLPVG